MYRPGAWRQALELIAGVAVRGTEPEAGKVAPTLGVQGHNLAARGKQDPKVRLHRS